MPLILRGVARPRASSGFEPACKANVFGARSGYCATNTFFGRCRPCCLHNQRGAGHSPTVRARDLAGAEVTVPDAAIEFLTHTMRFSLLDPEMFRIQAFPFRNRIYHPDPDGAKSSLSPSTFSGKDHLVTSMQLFGCGEPADRAHRPDWPRRGPGSSTARFRCGTDRAWQGERGIGSVERLDGQSACR
jgi:hypothetical protein